MVKDPTQSSKENRLFFPNRIYNYMIFLFMKFNGGFSENRCFVWEVK